MGRIVDRRNIPLHDTYVPSMKPAVNEFVPCDDGDPAEVDEFNDMISKLRDQGVAVYPETNERPPSRH
jgi:hypothetical protein